MSKLTKFLKAGAFVGACGIGLCALNKKYSITSRLADYAHTVEIGPFPGTRAYAFLASRQMRELYTAVADEITNEGAFSRILDVGTGTGYLPLEIAARNPEASIYGLDESSSMIQIAEANRLAMRIGKNVEFVTGSPTTLPFPGRFFDLVVCVNVLHHWKKPHDVLDEVYHTLVPGGEFRIYDYRNDVKPETWDKIKEKLPLHLRIPFAIGPVASGKAAYSNSELKKMIKRTNFELVSMEHRQFKIFGQNMAVYNLIKLRKPEIQSGKTED